MPPTSSDAQLRESRVRLDRDAVRSRYGAGARVRGLRIRRSSRARDADLDAGASQQVDHGDRLDFLEAFCERD